MVGKLHCEVRASKCLCFARPPEARTPTPQLVKRAVDTYFQRTSKERIQLTLSIAHRYPELWVRVRTEMEARIQNTLHIIESISLQQDALKTLLTLDRLTMAPGTRREWLKTVKKLGSRVRYHSKKLGKLRGTMLADVLKQQACAQAEVENRKMERLLQ